MYRRTLLATAAGVLLAGCITGESVVEESSAENESAGDDDSEEGMDDDSDDGSDGVGESSTTSDESSEANDQEIIDEFTTTLEDRGFERVDVEYVDDVAELGYDASGTTEDDVATEIERIADGYTTTIEAGLSPTHLEATANDPTTGDVLDYFAIETEWVEAYLSGEIEWTELLVRIAETFVSTASDVNGEDDPDDEP